MHQIPHESVTLAIVDDLLIVNKSKVYREREVMLRIMIHSFRSKTECPEMTIFNLRTQLCDYPKNVLDC
jgi:hypothetical protein